MSEPTLFETSVDSRKWILLDLRKAELARDHALEDSTMESFKRFCQDLRSSKLRFRSEDRQDRGAFDDGAGLLVEWADDVLAKLDELDCREFDRVRGGIHEHRIELADHLNTPADQRPAIG